MGYIRHLVIFSIILQFILYYIARIHLVLFFVFLLMSFWPRSVKYGVLCSIGGRVDVRCQAQRTQYVHVFRGNE